MSKYIISWSKTKSRWVASTDAGATWQNLRSDNPDDSSEAVDEADLKFGVASHKWDVTEEV